MDLTEIKELVNNLLTKTGYPAVKNFAKEF